MPIRGRQIQSAAPPGRSAVIHQPLNRRRSGTFVYSKEKPARLGSRYCAICTARPRASEIAVNIERPPPHVRWFANKGKPEKKKEKKIERRPRDGERRMGETFSYSKTHAAYNKRRLAAARASRTRRRTKPTIHRAAATAHLRTSGDPSSFLGKASPANTLMYGRPIVHRRAG